MLTPSIAQAEETLKLSQPIPNLEALIAESEAKVVNLKQDHAEATRLESFINTELAVLAEHFNYVKSEYMRLANHMSAYYAILEDNECATENKEHLIARARAILAIRQENVHDEAHLKQVTERSDVELVLQ